jgi:rare lipoprotein A
MKQFKKYGVKSFAFAIAALSSGAAYAQCGVASYYWQGKVTANGERYNPDGVSAAHKTLPFGTRVIVRHQRTGKTITVRINDRGPFIKGRIIDLSRGANRIFGMDGVAPVCISVVSYGNGRYVGSRQRTRSASARRGNMTLLSRAERKRLRLARRNGGAKLANVKTQRYSTRTARARQREAYNTDRSTRG